VTSAFEVGSYWDSRTQIDVVGLRKDGWTDLGECKWSATVSLPAVAEELEQKIRSYPNARQATIGRRLFVRSFNRVGRATRRTSVSILSRTSIHWEGRGAIQRKAVNCNHGGAGFNAPVGNLVEGWLAVCGGRTLVVPDLGFTSGVSISKDP
jgi:uncharacterized protein DUF234